MMQGIGHSRLLAGRPQHFFWWEKPGVCSGLLPAHRALFFCSAWAAKCFVIVHGGTGACQCLSRLAGWSAIAALLSAPYLVLGGGGGGAAWCLYGLLPACQGRKECFLGRFSNHLLLSGHDAVAECAGALLKAPVQALLRRC